VSITTKDVLNTTLSVVFLRIRRLPPTIKLTATK